MQNLKHKLVIYFLQPTSQNDLRNVKCAVLQFFYMAFHLTSTFNLFFV